jgi:hypothetical protein
VGDFPKEIFKSLKKSSENCSLHEKHSTSSTPTTPNLPVEPTSAGDSRAESKENLASTNTLSSIDSESLMTPHSINSDSEFDRAVNSGVIDEKIKASSDSLAEDVFGDSPGSGAATPKVMSPISSSHRSDTLRAFHNRAGSGSFDHLRQDSNPATKLTLDAAVGAGKSVSKIVGAGLKSPMDFTMGLAQGFHNAPKLYGDDTVRKSEPITGFQSGLKAAGKVSYHST